MWVLFAGLSAVFAGATAILSKCGVKSTDSTAATAVRTSVVFVFAWLMAFIVGSVGSIVSISLKTAVFLALSGLATGASWLCYYKALQRGDVNKVVPIDKSSTVLVFILSLIFFEEKLTPFNGVGMTLTASGIFLMIEKKDAAKGSGRGWIVYAALSAVFAALTAILGKVGISGVESNLGTAIRTSVVLVVAWIMTAATGKTSALKSVPRKEWLFLILSGLATGASWLCYYKALQSGITSVVVAIDKCSVFITVAFSFIFLKERLSVKASIGLALMLLGTALMIVEIFV